MERYRGRVTRPDKPNDNSPNPRDPDRKMAARASSRPSLAARVGETASPSYTYWESPTLEDLDEAIPRLDHSLDETTQRIYTLNAISAAISREENLDRVLQHALGWVLEISRADAGAVLLLNAQTRELELAASGGLSETFLRNHSPVPFGVGLDGAVAEAGRPLVVTDAQADPRTLEAALREGVRSYAGAPLFSDNEVVGVISVLSRSPREFTPVEIELLLSIGNQIGVAARKAQLREASTESREQLRQKMHQLQELLNLSATFRANAPLEPLLNTVCSSISSALGYRLVELNLLDPDTGMIAPYAFAGFTPQEREWLKGIKRTPEFYDRVMRRRFRISNSYFLSHRDNREGELGAEWAFRSAAAPAGAEGDWQPRDSLAVPLHDRDGGLVGMLYVDDPVDRRLPTVEQVQALEIFVQQAALAVENARLLEEVQKSEAQYRLLAENASDLIFLLEPDGAIGFVSSSARRVLDYEPSELVGKPFGDLVAPSGGTAPSYLLRPSSADSASVTEELAGRSEVELLRRDGSTAFLEINSAPVFENGKFRGRQGIGRDITEKKRMEREIARRQRQLRLSQKREEQLSGYAATVIAAQEEERKRIARDLHDDTAQALIALSRRIDMVRDELLESPEAAARKLDDLKELTDQTLGSVRRFSRDLRPSVLDDLGLVPALEWLVFETASRHEIATQLKAHGDQRRLPPEVELACFRIAQEALNNTVKHSGATAASIDLQFTPNWLRLSISDNGKGFESPPAIAELTGRGRMGVMGMHERASLLGGSLSLRTSPGEGARIAVSIPLNES
jgi:PAS domain S-box-containing protein